MAQNAAIIFDTSIVEALMIASGGTTDILEELFDGGRKFVLTPAVRAELAASSNTGVATFLNWTDAHASQRLGANITIEAADFETYRDHLDKVDDKLISGLQPLTPGFGEQGDVSIAKFLDDPAVSGQKFIIAAHDTNLFDYNGPGSYASYQGIVGLLDDEYRVGNIAASNYKSYATNLNSSNVLNGISDKLPKTTLTDLKVDNYEAGKRAIAESLGVLGDDSGAVNINYVTKFGVAAVALEVADRLGGVFDVVTFTAVFNEAEILRSEGNTSEANELWTKYIFETVGGTATGISVGSLTGFLVGLTGTKGVGGVAAPVLGAVAGGFAGGLAGAELGESLYNQFPDFFDGIFDDLYALADSIAATGKTIPEALAEAVIQTLGFDLSAVDGTGDADLLWASQFGERNGNAGEDLIVGFGGRSVDAGQVIDPSIPDSGVAENDLYLHLDGGADNDTIIVVGGEGVVAEGDAGNDFIAAFGGAGHLLDGGSGDDTFWAVGSAGTVIETGAGADTVWWSSNVGVTDLSMDDRVKLMGVVSLYGGSRSVTSESEWALGLGGVVQYGLNDDGELVINLPWLSEGNQDMFILNWENSKIDDFTGGGNITLFEYETWGGRLLDDNKPSGLTQAGFWEVFGLTIKTMVGWNAWGGGDPLVLDLDGDGIELTTLNSISPQYDIDYDLYAEQMAFAKGDDGVLARDINGDGVINDASELFGYGTTSGFSVLATLDGNLDGVVNAGDNGLADFNGDGTVDANDTFGSLLVWQDADRDVQSDAGELTTLDALGIVSISLSTATPASEAADGGNRITETSTFTWSDGSQGDIANVVFRVDNQDSEYIGAPITVSAAAEALPDLRASGTVVTLREAMSNRADSLTAVSNALTGFTTPDLDVLRDEVRPILAAWAEGSPIRLPDGTIVDGPAGLSDYEDIVVVRDGNGNIVDWGAAGSVLEGPQYTASVLSGDDIAIHERLIGESLGAFYLEPDNPAASLNVMTQLINNIEQDLDLFAVRIAVQGGPLAHHFSSIDYSVETDKFSSNSGDQLTSVFASLMTAAAAEGNPIGWLSGWEGFLDVLIGDYSRGGAYLKNSYGFLAQNIVAAYEQVAPGFAFIDAANALGVPSHLFSLGSDTVNGTVDADIFYLNAGDQTLIGAGGIDNYIVGSVIGHDIIDDREVYGQDNRGSDYLRFSAHNAVDITASRNGIDLILTINATGETITVKNQFDGEWPAPIVGDTSDNTGVNEIMFADGEVWTKLDIAFAVSNPDPASTVVNGTRDIDVLEGGPGDDTLNGGGDGDVYIFGRGDGADQINDNEDNDFRDAFDVLQFTDGITQDELTFTRSGDSGTVTIGIAGSTDSITINGQFNASETGSFGTWWEDRIEIFTFEDGTGLNYDDIMDLTLAAYSTDSDDSLYGFDRPDRLDAGAGNDFLSGGDYDDTYIFGRGYGQDVILDNLQNILTGDFDRLIFNSDVSPEAIEFLPSVGGQTNSLTLRIAGTTDTVTLSGQFGLTPTGSFGTIAFDRIEEAIFTDGSGVVWTSDYMRERVLEAAATSGDDHIFAYTTPDVIDGGAGNDTLEGYGSSDTYLFGRGSGNDLIREENENILLTDTDAIDFGDITFAEVAVSREGNSLSFTIIDTGETVTVENQYSRWTAGGRWQNVEEFRFTDGTISYTDLDPEDIVITGTLGDDTLTGTLFSETFDAKEGNDHLIGKDDADTYWFGAGYGNDVITDVRGFVSWGGDDIVKFTSEVTTSNIELARSNKDLIITIDGYSDQLIIEDQFGTSAYRSGVEQFHFSDGSIWNLNDLLAAMATDGDDYLLAFESDDTFAGGLGDDILAGDSGDDTYLYDLGEGADTILETGGYTQGGSADRLILGANIAVGAVTVTRSIVDPDDAILTFADGGSVTLDEQFSYVSSRLGVEYIEFADGTVWTENDLKAFISVSGSTSGNDVINGFAGDDVLSGGLGDDTLYGGNGDDTYLYSMGDGADVIYETGGYTQGGTADRIEFGPGIVASSVTLARAGDDLILSFSDGGSVTFDEQFEWSSERYGVEQFLFADGVEWTEADIRVQLLDQAATSGDDAISGFATPDTLAGHTGDDTLSGGDGDDAYIYNLGDGNDVVFDNYNNGDLDILRLGAGILPEDVTISFPAGDSDDVLLTFIDGGSVLLDEQFRVEWTFGVERIEFADGRIWTENNLLHGPGATPGNDFLNGFDASDDTLEGGLGNDELSGKDGADTYVFTAGDGVDVISDAGDGDTDSLLLHGVTPADAIAGLQISETADLVLTFSGSSDKVTIVNGLAGTAKDTVEEIIFDDGTVWTAAHLQAQLSAPGATAGADSITATSADELIVGGPGDDTLSGRDGTDIYVFNAGDGVDEIHDNGYKDTDRLVINGYSPDEVSIARNSQSGNSLVLTFAGSSDQVTLVDTLNENNNHTIELIEFDDGTIWTMADMRVRVVSEAATGSDDYIYGFDTSGDVLEGGSGNDTLRGEDGSDTYVFNPGDGVDTIIDDGWDDTDRLVIHSYAPGQVSIARDHVTGADLILTFAGSSDQITIIETLIGDRDNTIEKIEFDDGTVWDVPSLAANPALWSTDGDDYILGTNGADTLQGLEGDDTIHGTDGNDVYVYNLGDGNDFYGDGYGQGDADRIELGAGILPGETVITKPVGDLDNVVLTFANGGSIEIVNQLQGGPERGIETIAFDDGTTWDIAYLAANAQIIGSAGDDYILGSNSGEIIRGLAGNDTIHGTDGDDVYVYTLGDGNDFYGDGYGQGGADRIELGAGILPGETVITKPVGDLDNIVLTFADGGSIEIVNQLQGGPERGIETIGFDDGTTWNIAYLAANAGLGGAVGNDTINGSSGADIIHGFSGDDYLAGAAGNDSLVGGAGEDTISGGSGADTLDGGDGSDTIDYLSSAAGVAIQLNTGLATGGDAEGDTFISIENVIGSAFNDGIAGDDSDNVLNGAGGDDELVGRDGADTITGGAGLDTIYGGAGADSISAGTGADYVSGGSENDIIDGGGGNDELSGGNQNDSITGGDGDDMIYGSDGDDTLFGNAGADLLSGASNNDIIDGGDGDDTIFGGRQNDVLTGGNGNDTFLYTGGEIDVITDFTAGATSDDVIEISGLGAAFDTYAEVLAAAADDGTDTTIDFGNGDVIILEGVLVSQLHSDDFIFA